MTSAPGHAGPEPNRWPVQYAVAMVQAVASIDGVALPAAPGPRTREAQQAFAAARDAELAAAG